MTQTLYKIISLFFVIWFILSWFSNWAHVYFGEDNWTFTQNCKFKIDIMIDTQWAEISTAWIWIINNDWYQVLNFDYSGWIFASYTSPVKWFSKQKNFLWKEYSYIMWTNASSTKFNWIWKFATVTIKPDDWLRDVSIKFYAIKWFWGDDSNIIIYTWWKSIDILNSFSNWTYKLLRGTCFDDTMTNTFAETKLNKNPNVDLSKYPNWIDQTNVDSIVMIQKSKILFWLSENKAILLLLWFALIMFSFVIRKKLKGKYNYSWSVSVPFQPTPQQIPPQPTSTTIS